MSWWEALKKTLVFRTINFLVCLSLITGSFPDIYAQSALPSSQRAELAPNLHVQPFLEDLNFSKEIGKIREIFIPENTVPDKLIIHIADAHCNPKAQENIEKLLEKLIKEHGFHLIGVEGAKGYVDTTLLHQGEEKQREAVIREYLDKGLLTGAELLGMRNGEDLPFEVFGLENPVAYLENFIALRGTFSEKKETVRFQKELGRVIEIFKTKLFTTQELNQLDKQYDAFNQGELKRSDYILYLTGFIEQKDLSEKNPEISFILSPDKTPFPNFRKTSEIAKIEKSIDFEKIKNEQKSIKDALEKENPDSFKEYKDKEKLCKEGDLSPLGFYSYVMGLVSGLNEKPQCENLQKYVEVLKLFKNIRTEKLMGEVREITLLLKLALCDSEDQKSLVHLENKLSILERLTDLRLTREQLAFFKSQTENFYPSKLLEWPRKKASELNIAWPKILEEQNFSVPFSIESARDYYHGLIQRDVILVDNLMARMEEQNIKKAILVSGGFHSEGMTDLLRERKIAYAVVTPIVGKPTDLYFQVMMDSALNVTEAYDAAVNGLAPVLITDSQLGINTNKFLDSLLSKLESGTQTLQMTKEIAEDLKLHGLTLTQKMIAKKRITDLISKNSKISGNVKEFLNVLSGELSFVQSVTRTVGDKKAQTTEDFASVLKLNDAFRTGNFASAFESTQGYTREKDSRAFAFARSDLMPIRSIMVEAETMLKNRAQYSEAELEYAVKILSGKMNDALNDMLQKGVDKDKQNEMIRITKMTLMALRDCLPVSPSIQKTNWQQLAQERSQERVDYLIRKNPQSFNNTAFHGTGSPVLDGFVRSQGKLMSLKALQDAGIVRTTGEGVSLSATTEAKKEVFISQVSSTDLSGLGSSLAYANASLDLPQYNIKLWTMEELAQNIKDLELAIAIIKQKVFSSTGDLQGTGLDIKMVDEVMKKFMLNDVTIRSADRDSLSKWENQLKEFKEEVEKRLKLPVNDPVRVGGKIAREDSYPVLFEFSTKDLAVTLRNPSTGNNLSGEATVDYSVDMKNRIKRVYAPAQFIPHLKGKLQQIYGQEYEVLAIEGLNQNLKPESKAIADKKKFQNAKNALSSLKATYGNISRLQVGGHKVIQLVAETLRENTDQFSHGLTLWATNAKANQKSVSDKVLQLSAKYDLDTFEETDLVELKKVRENMEKSLANASSMRSSLEALYKGQPGKLDAFREATELMTQYAAYIQNLKTIEQDYVASQGGVKVTALKVLGRFEATFEEVQKLSTKKIMKEMKATVAEEVFTADLGENIPGINFEKGGKTYIILNSREKFSQMRDEVVHHESTEAKLKKDKTLADSEMVKKHSMERVSHIIASAEEILQFSKAGKLTGYHDYDLNQKSPEALMDLYLENQMGGRKVQQQILAEYYKDQPAKLQQIKEYEAALLAKAKELYMKKTGHRCEDDSFRNFALKALPQSDKSFSGTTSRVTGMLNKMGIAFNAEDMQQIAGKIKIYTVDSKEPLTTVTNGPNGEIRILMDKKSYGNTTTRYSLYNYALLSEMNIKKFETQQTVSAEQRISEARNLATAILDAAYFKMNGDLPERINNFIKNSGRDNLRRSLKSLIKSNNLIKKYCDDSVYKTQLEYAKALQKKASGKLFTTKVVEERAGRKLTSKELSASLVRDDADRAVALAELFFKHGNNSRKALMAAAEKLSGGNPAEVKRLYKELTGDDLEAVIKKQFSQTPMALATNGLRHNWRAKYLLSVLENGQPTKETELALRLGLMNYRKSIKNTVDRKDLLDYLRTYNAEELFTVLNNKDMADALKKTDMFEYTMSLLNVQVNKSGFIRFNANDLASQTMLSSLSQHKAMIDTALKNNKTAEVVTETQKTVASLQKQISQWEKDIQASETFQGRFLPQRADESKEEAQKRIQATKNAGIALDKLSKIREELGVLSRLVEGKTALDAQTTKAFGEKIDEINLMLHQARISEMNPAYVEGQNLLNIDKMTQTLSGKYTNPADLLLSELLKIHTGRLKHLGKQYVDWKDFSQEVLKSCSNLNPEEVREAIDNKKSHFNQLLAGHTDKGFLRLKNFLHLREMTNHQVDRLKDDIRALYLKESDRPLAKAESLLKSNSTKEALTKWINKDDLLAEMNKILFTDEETGQKLKDPMRNLIDWASAKNPTLLSSTSTDKQFEVSFKILRDIMDKAGLDDEQMKFVKMRFMYQDQASDALFKILEIPEHYIKRAGRYDTNLIRKIEDLKPGSSDYELLRRNKEYLDLIKEHINKESWENISKILALDKINLQKDDVSNKVVTPETLSGWMKQSEAYKNNPAYWGALLKSSILDYRLLSHTPSGKLYYVTYRIQNQADRRAKEIVESTKSSLNPISYKDAYEDFMKSVKDSVGGDTLSTKKFWKSNYKEALARIQTLLDGDTKDKITSKEVLHRQRGRLFNIQTKRRTHIDLIEMMINDLSGEELMRDWTNIGSVAKNRTGKGNDLRDVDIADELQGEFSNLLKRKDRVLMEKKLRDRIAKIAESDSEAQNYLQQTHQMKKSDMALLASNIRSKGLLNFERLLETGTQYRRLNNLSILRSMNANKLLNQMNKLNSDLTAHPEQRDQIINEGVKKVKQALQELELSQNEFLAMRDLYNAVISIAVSLVVTIILIAISSVTGVPAAGPAIILLWAAIAAILQVEIMMLVNMALQGDSFIASDAVFEGMANVGTSLLSAGIGIGMGELLNNVVGFTETVKNNWDKVFPFLGTMVQTGAKTVSGKAIAIPAGLLMNHFLLPTSSMAQSAETDTVLSAELKTRILNELAHYSSTRIADLLKLQKEATAEGATQKAMEISKQISQCIDEINKTVFTLKASPDLTFEAKSKIMSQNESVSGLIAKMKSGLDLEIQAQKALMTKYSPVTQFSRDALKTLALFETEDNLKLLKAQNKFNDFVSIIAKVKTSQKWTAENIQNLITLFSSDSTLNKSLMENWNKTMSEQISMEDRAEYEKHSSDITKLLTDLQILHACENEEQMTSVMNLIKSTERRSINLKTSVDAAIDDCLQQLQARKTPVQTTTTVVKDTVDQTVQKSKRESMDTVLTAKSVLTKTGQMEVEVQTGKKVNLVVTTDSFQTANKTTLLKAKEDLKAKVQLLTADQTVQTAKHLKRDQIMRLMSEMNLDQTKLAEATKNMDENFASFSRGSEGVRKFFLQYEINGKKGTAFDEEMMTKFLADSPESAEMALFYQTLRMASVEASSEKINELMAEVYGKEKVQQFTHQLQSFELSSALESVVGKSKVEELRVKILSLLENKSPSENFILEQILQNRFNAGVLDNLLKVTQNSSFEVSGGIMNYLYKLMSESSQNQFKSFETLLSNMGLASYETRDMALLLNHHLSTYNADQEDLSDDFQMNLAGIGSRIFSSVLSTTKDVQRDTAQKIASDLAASLKLNQAQSKKLIDQLVKALMNSEEINLEEKGTSSILLKRIVEQNKRTAQFEEFQANAALTTFELSPGLSAVKEGGQIKIQLKNKEGSVLKTMTQQELIQKTGMNMEKTIAFQAALTADKETADLAVSLRKDCLAAMQSSDFSKGDRKTLFVLSEDMEESEIREVISFLKQVQKTSSAEHHKVTGSVDQLLTRAKDLGIIDETFASEVRTKMTIDKSEASVQTYQNGKPMMIVGRTGLADYSKMGKTILLNSKSSIQSSIVGVMAFLTKDSKYIDKIKESYANEQNQDAKAKALKQLTLLADSLSDEKMNSLKVAIEIAIPEIKPLLDSVLSQIADEEETVFIAG